MKIGFIGAGKVGTAFGKHLADNGFRLSGYYSEPHITALQAAGLTDSLAYESSAELIAASDVVFITTPDDVIESVGVELAEHGLLLPRHIVGHMSGALSSEIFSEVRKKTGCEIFSLHPLQAFAELSNSLNDLPHTYFSLEGSPGAQKPLQAIMDKLGNPLLEIEQEHKILYHAAACVVSNYLVALLDEGLDYLERIGIDKQDGLQAMLPLIEGSLANTAKLGPATALTGPIARGDAATVKKHLDNLAVMLPEKKELYQRLGLRTLALAKQRKLQESEKTTLLKNYLEGNHE